MKKLQLEILQVKNKCTENSYGLLKYIIYNFKLKKKTVKLVLVTDV